MTDNNLEVFPASIGQEEKIYTVAIPLCANAIPIFVTVGFLEPTNESVEDEKVKVKIHGATLLMVPADHIEDSIKLQAIKASYDALKILADRHGFKLHD